MNLNFFQFRSIKTKITLFTLVIFIIMIWSLSFYISRLLHQDMERVLSQQQFALVNLMAREINHDLEQRLEALTVIASKVTPEMINDASKLQKVLDDHPIFQQLFNDGTLFTRTDGVAVAEFPSQRGRIGLNYLDREAVALALNEGKASISHPVMGRPIAAPLFGIVTPIFDKQKRVLGTLTGVTNLAKPNFLDKITATFYGKTGGFFLVAPEQRLIITATNKKRIMARLPKPGEIPAIDRFLEGYEGSAIYVNQFGKEMLASAKRIPVANWGVSASMTTEEVFEPIYRVLQHMLIATIFLTLLACSLIWWMLRNQLAPLLSTAKTLAKFSDQPQRMHSLGVTSQDEIGGLISSFNNLLEILVKRENALQVSERKLALILENVEAYIYLKDLEGRYLFVNRLVRELFGADLESIVGFDDGKFFDAETVAQICANDRQVLIDGLIVKTEERNLNVKDGRTSIYLSVKIPLRNELGGIYALCGISTDITERKRMEDALRQSEGKYHTLFDSTQEAVLILDEHGFYDCNKAATALFGCASREQLCSYHPADLSPPVQPSGENSETLANQHIATALCEGSLRFEWLHKRVDDGRLFTAEFLLSAMTLNGKQVLQAIGRDISERKFMEEQIRQLAFYDPLTQLPNRRLLNDRLSQAMVASKRNGCYGAVLFLDLDNFKPLNDKYGHVVGDLLLIEAARRLRACIRQMDTVARFGGDEFVVMLSSLSNNYEGAIAQAKLIAGKIAASLSELYRLNVSEDVQELQIVEHQSSASIGVMVFINHQYKEHEILDMADAAMYEAKRAGRNQIRFYERTKV